MKLKDRIFLSPLIPEALFRWGIRHQIKDRLEMEKKKHKSGVRFEKLMSQGMIAQATDSANEQHYEVNENFFKLALGKYLKYSSAYWLDEEIESHYGGAEDNVRELSNKLDDAEKRMLELTLKRAEIQSGAEILELGCGWGSLTLFMAERFPKSKITAVSNSHGQQNYIQGEMKKRGLKNIEVLCCDINKLELSKKFDSVVSVEMFEHMRNYSLLLSQVKSWMKKDATLFVHIFVHDTFTYPMDTEEDSWMARNFFTGGIFPAFHIFDNFTKDLQVEKSWKVNGRHYGLTAEAWYQKSLLNREKMEAVFADSAPFLGLTPTQSWVAWKIFFLACAELFAWNEGEEWYVGHYLLR